MRLNARNNTVVRPLMEIQKPWITREQMEAAIWRLTGIKNAVAVEQLLRLADVYAVSQGPGLIDKLRERDRNRDRWQIHLPASYPAARMDKVTHLRLAEEPEPELELSDELEPELSEPEVAIAASDFTPADLIDFSTLPQMPGVPPKAAPVWELPDGRMFQRCSGCGAPKDYDSFHRDSYRWNGRSSQCKVCKNNARRAS